MSEPTTVDRWRAKAIVATTCFMQMISVAAALYQEPNYWKQDYHTSALTGQAWVEELIHGHPDRIYCELGMRLHVFVAFVANLQLFGGLEMSQKGITVEEQAAIFLYTCVTGLSERHVAERFQHSRDTISKYFKKVLHTVSAGPFYQHYVNLPTQNTPLSSVIRNNPKFFPFFQNVVGAIDGTHINLHAQALERHMNRDRKGGVTQNCLFGCDMDFQFVYGITGFEGSTADSTMYSQARLLDFTIPAGKCYLADAGFPACDGLLVPYRNVRYHLAEWGRAGIRPTNKEELYNLRHAQLRTIIERIFGVMKRRWNILNHAREYDFEIQAQIPSGLISVHNFIIENDDNDIEHCFEMPYVDIGGAFSPLTQPAPEELGQGSIPRREYQRALAIRSEIASQMWGQYQQFIQEHPEVLQQEFDPETV